MLLVAVTAVVALSGQHAYPALPSSAPAAWFATAPLSAADEPGERVVVSTKDKLSLTGSYWAPKGKQKSPGALLIHGAGATRLELDGLAQRLHKIGFAVLTVDLRGHGDSAKDGEVWDELAPRDHEVLWAFAKRDLEAGIEFLRDRAEVHSSSLVLVGHRAGATLVASHAVRDANVRAIALFDPPSEESQMYGFHLEKDIEDLGGLPTYISVPKEGHKGAQRMADDGQRANGGLEFIRISVFRGESTDLLSDAREMAEAAKWLKERAFPSKARKPRSR